MANRRFQPPGADYTDLSGRYSMSRGPSDTLMDRMAELRNRKRATTKAVTIAILMVIMDMSGLSGVYAGELDERQDKRETHSGLNAPGFMTGVADQVATMAFTGGNHGACAVMDNGELACWGQGSHYLIYSNGSSSLTPVVREDFPVGLSVSEITLGDQHRCALMSNSKVYCWGGMSPAFTAPSGFNSERPTPTVVQNIAGNDILATQVDSGDYHSCAILTDGSTVCWGYNYYGQLGVGYRCVTGAEGICQGSYQGDQQERLEQPTEVILPTGRTAVALNMYEQNSCFVLDDGSYMCAGSDFDNLATPINVTYGYGASNADTVVAAFRQQVIISNGELHYMYHSGNTPYINSDVMGTDYYNSTGNYQGHSLFDNAVSASMTYQSEGCALMTNGSVLCGNQPYISSNGVTERVWLDTPSGVEASAVVGNYYTRCVVYSNGSAQCWGHNNIGQIGAGYACVYGTSDPNDCNSDNAVETPRWISLPAGRHIALSEADSDDDGIWNLLDNCPTSSITWTSNTTSDYDQDGCRDVDEDDDDNGDGVTDTDFDGDGYGDIIDDDDDDDGVTDPDVDGDGYGDDIDFDFDGYDNIDDDFPHDSTEWDDYDGDGIGNNADTDDDGDGYDDTVDSHPLNHLFHHTLTMADGWIIGGRYENVSVAYSDLNSDYVITESESSTIRAVAYNPSIYAISTDNQLVEHDGTPITVNWDTSDGVTAIASVSTNQHCVILESGAVRCWGSNSNGQLGAPTSASHYTPATSSNVSFPVNYPAKHISMSNDQSCAVLENGEVYCWGYNPGWGGYSLGSGTTCDSGEYQNGCDGNYNWDEPYLPVLLPTNASAKSIYISGNTNAPKCVVLSDGNAACWGGNEAGALGTGNTINLNTPQLVYLPPGITADIQAIAVDGWSNGYGTTCGLWGNGSIYCWGNNEAGQLGDGTICPGGNYENNCNGYGDKPIIYDPVILPAGTQAIALWQGCALLTTGGVFCWGGNNNDDNHTGTYQDFLTLGDFIQPGNRDWDSDGVYNTEDNCAAGIQGWTSTSTNDFDSDGCIDATEDTDDDGDSYSDSAEIACGTDPLNGTDVPLDPDNDGICNAFDDDDDNDGVLDVDDEFPNDPYGFVQLSLGDGFQSGQPEDNATLGNSGETTCAILSDDTLRCWGENNRGQIGDGTRGTQRYTPTNVSLPAGKIPVSVSTSGTYGDHICAIMDDGSLYCWGYNNYGQLGVGTYCQSGSYINGCNGNTGRSTPSQVQLPTGRTATAVSSGYYHTCAILDDGSVWCWGGNGQGELGVGNSSNSGNWRYSPNAVMMPSGTTAVALALGDQHSCMVVDDGRAFCWGDGDSGHNGDGSGLDLNIPTQVSGTASYVSISSGPQFSCAITNLGTVQCWGLNNQEQLGLGYDGSHSYSYPQNTALPAGIEVSSIALGSEHACAVLETMSVYCWGMDDQGQLNTAYECQNDYTNGCGGSSRHTPAPTQLPTGRNGIAVIAGYHYTCVFVDNGGVYCFGANDEGQLGNGTHYGSGPSYVGFPVGISPQTNDRDLDHDGVFNNEDQCMEGETGWTSNNSTDNDGDGCQDSSEDLDDDNDFLSDSDEAIAGTNATNPDTDGDGYLDGLDDFPLDGSEWLDTDGDGIGNNADTDDDDDGWSDLAEYYCLTDPLNGTDIPSDFDGDGNCDYTDNDDDNDGTYDSEDDFPYDAGADTDTDGDGMPDTLVANYTGNLTEDFDDDDDGWNDTVEIDCGYNPLSNMSTPTDTDGDTICDDLDVFPNDPDEWDDTDGDGVGDNGDDFPDDANETTDTDGDGIGDNGDPDADDDGWSNTEEGLCLTDWLDNTSVPGDIDGDGICDAQEQDLDNDGWTNSNESVCGTDWTDVNSVPVDTDGDWICDIMDNDDDGDGYFDDVDVFPLNPAEWADTDGDGVGNNADPDDDNDGCMDISDDLPLDPTECVDTDGDGTGNNADTDDDNDGLPDDEDPFPEDGAATVDTDGDGMPDSLNGNSTTGLVADPDDDNDGYNDTDDAFPLDDTEWYDTDGDGIGNNEDINDDGDNCPDVTDDFPLDPAECYDTDGDGIGNNADTDDDNDGWFDGTEMACGTSDPLNASSVPDDFDGDGVCDLMDVDDDNDSYLDSNDDFPYDPCAAVDTDGDGMPDWIFLNCNTTLTEDADDDDDGYEDANDTFPEDPSEWSDFDGDGIGNNADTDDDGDTVPDDYDEFPLNSTEWADNDGDGIGDNADTDDDNDGTLDTDDDFPFDAGATTDTDNDGMPDTVVSGYNGSLTEDLDDDGDGVLDIYDAFPLDSSEWSDTDGDGTGDNADADDDGDTWSDSDEYICGTDPLDSTDWPPDSDGDGICDSEDDDGPTTLGAKLIQFAAHPVTLWMLAIGVVVSLFLGMTATSMSMRRSREMRRDMLRDESSSIDRGVGWDRPTPGVEIPVQTSTLTAPPVVEDSQAKLQKLIDQGYSTEVAQVILENEEN
uniref:RCC1 domain-containing protein n=1 Tax=uncultured marine group II/III euryarchaeote KM3_62_D04 TaxID=1456473 RepID=A0A075HC15_9EURY|nr:RCC1 domain-containing protein [uncultured marine group II/III euryarchaeote KM3_62_D04]